MTKATKKGLVPKLRFPEFRDSGEWEFNLLGDAAKFSKGKGVSKSDIVQDGKLPCIRYGELYTIYGETIEHIYSYTNVDAEELVLSKADDVIIPASGETQGDIATASCVKLSGIALGGDLNIIQSDIDGVFLSYYLNSSKKNEIANMSQGISVIHLYSNQLKNLGVSVPVKKEQKKVADCLSSLDELLSAQVEKIDSLKDHKKGLMQKLFPAGGQTTPSLRFPEFRDNGLWEESLLGSCLTRTPEYGLNAPAVEYSQNLPTYLRITDISDDGIIYKDKKVSVDREVNEQNYLEDGDIVLARTGASVGKSYKYRVEDGRLVFAGFLIRVRPDEKKINSELLFQYFRTEQYWKWVDLNSARSGQPGINGQEYSSMPILLPQKIEEQQKIAECLSSLDDLINAYTQKFETLKAHKKGLMQQLFPSMVDINV